MTYFIEFRELIPVHGGHCDDLRPSWEVLSHTSCIPSILIEPNKLRYLIVFILQVDGQSSVIVQRVGSPVLKATFKF